MENISDGKILNKRYHDSTIKQEQGFEEFDVKEQKMYISGSDEEKEHHPEVIDTKALATKFEKGCDSLIKSHSLFSPSYQGRIIIQIIQELHELKETLEVGISALNEQVIQTSSLMLSEALKKGENVQEILYSNLDAFNITEIRGDEKFDPHEIIKIEPVFDSYDNMDFDNDWCKEDKNSNKVDEDYVVQKKSSKPKGERKGKGKKKDNGNYNAQFLKQRKCEHCDVEFAGMTKLLEHINTVHEDARPYKCSECDRCYAKRKHLNRHMAVAHSGIKPFKCDLCDAAFCEKRHLDNHHLRLHTTERPFKCDLCNKGYLHQRELTQHMRSHDEKPTYTCDQCMKTFTQAQYLEWHMKKFINGVCPGEYPFKCNVCEKKFKKKAKLNVHVLIHGEERNFKCKPVICVSKLCKYK